jgi:GT2 family glycosyltransferase
MSQVPSAFDMRDLKPKVAVVIPNWNGIEHIFECLDSVMKMEYTNFDVILVDNDSKDGSPEAVALRFPMVHIMRNSRNLGFAEGCNIGIEQAISNGVDYVWLLNNDVLVDPGALGGLVRAAENDQRIGMTGSKVFFYDDPQVLWGVGMKISWIRGETYPIGWREVDHGQLDECRAVDGLAGCSLLVKRQVCETVGLMDKRYFLYAEEIDWCVRARKQGFRCVVVPESIVFHKEGASSGEDFRPIFNYYNTRNMLFTISKNFLFPKREFYLCTVITCKLWKSRRNLAKALIVKLTGSKRFSFDVSAMLGVIDFITRQRGMKSRSAIMSFQNLREVAQSGEIPDDIAQPRA